MLNDLFKGKTWLLWDEAIAVGTITIDTEEPVDAHYTPIWPEHKRHEPALYVRRIVVSRKNNHLGLGAGLLDWAANVAVRDYDAGLIRVDVWTTNLMLHAYYEELRFTRCAGRDPRDLADYPSQVLFERQASLAGSRYTELFIEKDSPEERDRRSRHPRGQHQLAV